MPGPDDFITSEDLDAREQARADAADDRRDIARDEALELEREAARKRLAELEAREIHSPDSAEELEELRARADLVAELEQRAEDEAELAGEQAAEPLVAIARRRLRSLVESIGSTRAAPADLRDAGIAIAALSDAIERLELYDGRHAFHGSTLERWVRDLRALLELVGEPPEVDDERREDARIYWPVREGVLDELADALNLTDVGGVELSVGAGGGLFARLAALEAERDQAVERERGWRGEVSAIRRGADSRQAELARRVELVVGELERFDAGGVSRNDRAPRVVVADAVDELRTLAGQLRASSE